MMSTVQKWLLGLIALGAGYMVLQNPNSFYKATTGLERLTAGGVTQIATGGRRGG